jgi:photosystem II stability/assembly factor-like uncharacterized protein
MCRSHDGGATWNQTGFTYQQFETINIYRLVVDPVNPNNLLAGTETGMYRSTDAGSSWTQLDTTLTIDIKINPLDPMKYYAITEDGVRMSRSYDGGATWIPFFTTPQPNLHGDAMQTWNTLSYSVTITPTANGRIRFRYDNVDGCCGGSGTNNGWYLDDVKVLVAGGYS